MAKSPPDEHLSGGLPADENRLRRLYFLAKAEVHKLLIRFRRNWGGVIEKTTAYVNAGFERALAGPRDLDTTGFLGEVTKGARSQVEKQTRRIRHEAPAPDHVLDRAVTATHRNRPDDGVYCEQIIKLMENVAKHIASGDRARLHVMISVVRLHLRYGLRFRQIDDALAMQKQSAKRLYKLIYIVARRHEGEKQL